MSGLFSNKGVEDRFPEDKGAEVSCFEGKALAETLDPYEDLTASKIRFINSFEKGFFQEKSVQSVDVFVTSECIHLYILYCISLYPDVPPIERVINIIKSCKVIEVNPPL